VRTFRSRLWLVPLLWLGLASAFAQVKSAPAEVIYPRNAAESEVAPGATKPADRPASSLLLFLAVGAATAGGWFLWRQRQNGGALGAAPRKLAIAESRSLGNRQHLVVADYAGRKFLLGVCPGRIDLLAKLDERAEEDES
jgi:flagellar protein FliO/FliZ